MERPNNNELYNEAASFERTPAKQSLFFALVQAIIPGIALWFLFGNDVKINFLINLFHEPIWTKFVCIIVYAVWATITFVIPYIFRLTYLDQLSYTIPLFVTFSLIFFTSFYNESLNVAVRFIIIFGVALAISVVANMITVYLRMKKYRKHKIKSLLKEKDISESN